MGRPQLGSRDQYATYGLIHEGNDIIDYVL
jgi:hypothetical protein